MIPRPIRLTPPDAGRFVRLRARMLHEAPWAFDGAPGDDPLLDPAQVARLLAEVESAIFAIEAPERAADGAGPDLVACASVARARQRQYAHRARLTAVYAEPVWRGRGLGSAVVGAAVDLAHAWPGVDYVDLAVSENAPGALRLYENAGFVPWGREPEATEHQGRRYDEIYMTLRLRRAS